MKVSINEENLKTYIKGKLIEVIEQRTKQWRHINHDHKFSPAQWDVDPEGTIRHTLDTVILTKPTANGLHILLGYDIFDISPTQ